MDRADLGEYTNGVVFHMGAMKTAAILFLCMLLVCLVALILCRYAETKDMGEVWPEKTRKQQQEHF